MKRYGIPLVCKNKIPMTTNNKEIPMGQRVRVKKSDAEKVLAAIKQQFKPWIDAGGEQPTLEKDYDFLGHGAAPYAVVWEGGSPYEWAFMAGPNGGVDEEFGFRVKPVDFPPSVFTEPVTSFILAIYEAM